MSLEKFQNVQAKHLPVILLLDTSGSMQSDSKISTLNKAVEDMIDSFKKYNVPGRKIDILIITFGGTAQIHTDLISVTDMQDFKHLVANGTTPMGEALKIAKSIIENKDKIPSTCARPTVILVSDGQPKDDWQTPLNDFISSGRSSKTERMSMGIGADADANILKMFSKENNYYNATDANNIIEFFRFATMSVVNRNASVDPNVIQNNRSITDSINANYYSVDDMDDDF